MTQLSFWETGPTALSRERRDCQTPTQGSGHGIPNPEHRHPARMLKCGLFAPDVGSQPEDSEPRIPSGECRTPSMAEAAFERAFRRMFTGRPVPWFQVEYRAFAGLRTTVRLRGNRAMVHMSDLLADAAPLVIEALAEILLARLFRRRASREACECYLAWNMSPAVRSRVDEARRARGRKRLLPARGRDFDLQSIFDQLNQRFFRGQLAVVGIGWSPRRSRTLLGHYDPSYRTITISRWFDSGLVPPYLVEYLVYHEMLHIKHPTERNGHRRVVHTRAFREAEKEFPLYEEACKQLKRISSAEVW